MLEGGRAFHIKDAKGNPVRVLNPAGWCEWPLRGDARIDALRERLNRVWWGGGNRWILWPLTAGMIAGAICLGLVAKSASLPDWAARLIVVAGIIVAAGLMRGYGWRRDVGTRVADAILQDGLCAACGYNLHGIATEAGVITCPECGAAWEDARVQRRAPFEPTSVMGNPLPLMLGARKATPNYGTTTDHRGTRIALVKPGLKHARQAAYLPGHQEALARAHKRMRPLAMFLRWGAGPLCIAVGVFCFWLLQAQRYPSLGCFLGPASVLLVVAGALTTLGTFGLPHHRVIEAMTAEGLCPACGAMLPTAADEDGCIVCDCGAAWNLGWIHGRNRKRP